MDNGKMQIETSEGVLTYKRQFNAPRELVFRAFSSCEQLSHWWGPRTWPMKECELDFRPGGEWHFCLRGPNPEDESWGKVVYQEIIEPERIVYRDYFSDAEGNINEDLPSTLVTYSFSGRNDKTLLTGSAEYKDPADLQKVLDMGMMEGMTETLDRLEEYLAQVSKVGR